MCEDCGCGLPGKNSGESSQSHQEHDSDHPHSHGHTHDHVQASGHEPPHTHDHEQRQEHVPNRGREEDHAHSKSHSHGRTADEQPQSGRHRTVQVRQAVLSKNDRLAERNRGFFRARGLSVINVLSSPGSGKTTFLRETVRLLEGKMKAGIIVGDLATDNDAQRLRSTGAPVVQITTGTMCHLEADMIARALKQIPLENLGLLIIENVGNLVCPASFDLGEDLRIVLFSVTEGEDKPLKYPPMFQAADVVILSKMDLAQACEFKRDLALESLRRVAPNARIFETSARSGQGMLAWRDYLLEIQQRKSALDPLA